MESNFVSEYFQAFADFLLYELKLFEDRYTLKTFP